jgi:predicted lysophospholipase L1 biosynthesis ABC-type transport system permease subunit
LLIASANIANLLLARASARTQEMALRMAIGANRLRLLRQCLVESSLLGLLGSIAGILVAILLVAGLKQFGPTSLPRLQDVAIHPIVLLFALALSLITSLFFGPVLTRDQTETVRTSRPSENRIMEPNEDIGLAGALHLLPSHDRDGFLGACQDQDCQ